MSTVSRSTASVTFHGDDLIPDELSRLLGSLPTKSHKKGDKKSLNEPELTWSSGYWSFKVEDRSPGDLSCQINDLFKSLTDDSQIWLNLTSRFKARVFIGLFMEEWNEMIDLSPESLMLLADRNIKVGLDIYGPNEN